MLRTMSTRNRTRIALAAIAAMAIFAAPANAAPDHPIQPISIWTVDYSPAFPIVFDSAIADGLRGAGFTESRVVARLTAITRQAAQRLSGGNPNAFSQANGSYGLLQLLPDVFGTYHARGTSSRVYDPAANVGAAWNYLVFEHGVQPGTGEGAEVLLKLTELQERTAGGVVLQEPGPDVPLGTR